jgi:hypothetical protein
MATHENCADCVESYHTCQTWPANKPFTCADFYRLPDVLPGTWGQDVLASRMKGRTKPRARDYYNRQAKERERVRKGNQAGASVETLPHLEVGKARDQAGKAVGVSGRTQSPAATPGPDGERYCACGTTIAKRRRCCDICRRQRREKTLAHRRRRLVAV